MQPADDIRQLIHQSQITSSEQVDRRILADALADLENRRKASGTRAGVRRIIMHSKAIKLAAAAAVVIAVLFGLQFLGTSGITFAQAIQPILNANTAILDHVIGAEDPNAPVIHDMVMGSRIRRIVSSVPSVVSVIDLEEGKILTLVEDKREAIYTDLKGIKIPNYMDRLKHVIVMLQDSPHYAVEELGVQEIDGRKMVGFAAKHPRAEVTIWADPKTGLPVRMETREGQLTTISKNLRFDEPMDEALFSMEAPPDYKLQQTTELDLNSGTEADFVEGLRVMAELFNDGLFPDGVALEDFMKQVPTIRAKGEKLGLSPEEDAALSHKIQQYVVFLRAFKGEGKWYYRGKGVRLGEAQTPIFWYRPIASDTYRVIYGNLHVEDVAPENLPEPLDPDDVVKPSIGYQTWSKPEFVGTQDDLWQIQAGGLITVRSELTMRKGPEGVATLPITLPYETGVLTSASLADAPVAFRMTGPGQYDLQLPMPTLLAGSTKITCMWTLSLADLETAEFGYRVLLRSLIPVVSYRLKASIDPNSGYELTEPMKSHVNPSQSWAPMFTWSGAEPKADFDGTCGLTIRKQD